MTRARAIVALADGTVYEGRALGYPGETVGEVVFHTGMTGYQEIVTDPSYTGQIVLMTSPHIGNYGVTRHDSESSRVAAEGLIVKAACDRASNWRSEQSLEAYLREAHVVGIEGVDTRALTRRLRDAGSQQGIISHRDLDPHRAVEKARRAPAIVGRDLVQGIGCQKPYVWTEGSGAWQGDGRGPNGDTRFRVVVYDYGVKHNILRRLVDVGCDVTVVPASTPAASALALQPQGIVLSNGPGDPEALPWAVKTVRAFLEHPRLPILGICLGHQLLGLASGLPTAKLKFGHHAANHPVLDLETGKVAITSQNHTFAVIFAPGSAAASPPVLETPYGALRVTHRSLNDDAIEGLRWLDRPALSIQYHPEAAPGPHDSAPLFGQFTDMMEQSHG